MARNTGSVVLFLCGTPGVGKTTTADLIASECKLRHVELSRLIEEERLYDEWDEEMGCSVFDDDKVTEAVERIIEEHTQGRNKKHKNGLIFDFHSCGFIDDDALADKFDKIIVLHSETDVLYDRLEQRGYAEAKVRENVECEIFRVCLEEATDTFAEEKVVEMDSNSQSDLDVNVRNICNIVNELLNLQ
eukprot:GHVU01054805.1.p1 GENE.GHVU01054805.1~~GHVU01054805.1.p1  ORF type:complete len:189 (-),score=30.19 GHVU01054805.1:2198-2764(-)